jgi:hypothetical protein
LIAEELRPVTIIATASVPEQQRLEHCSTVDITTLRAARDLDTESWAREYISRPATSDADRRVQTIIADLLGQIEAGSRSPADRFCCSYSWCSMHTTSDDGLIHYSKDFACQATAGGPAERQGYYVGVELCEYPGQPLAAAVRVDGGNDPMTVDETLALAAALEFAARCAMERPA